MKIRLSNHFIERQKLRAIPENLAETILREADEHYRDHTTNSLVAVKRIMFEGKQRHMGLTYARAGDEFVLITLHPLKEDQKRRLIESRRWIPYEPESTL